MSIAHEIDGICLSVCAECNNAIKIMYRCRYWELVQVHGKLDPLVSVDLRPEKRVNITFTCGSQQEVRTVDVYRSAAVSESTLRNFSTICQYTMISFSDYFI